MPREKSLSKQCNIFKFLKRANPDLAEAVSDLCMEGSLSTKRGNGLTFIMPDSALTNKIIDATYSNDPEEAANLLSACILVSYADKASNFPTETGNKLGLKITLDKVDGSKVVLNGGKLVIEPNSSFKPMGDRQIAVWKLVSGAPVTKGDRFDFKTLSKKSKGKKKGGCSTCVDDTFSARQQLLERVQNAYVEKVYNKSLGKTTGGTDQAQKIVSSLVNRIYLAAEEENNINSPFTKAFTAIASVWDKDPQVMAALLLNPDPQLAHVLQPVYSKLQVNGGLDADLSLNAANEYSNYSDSSYVNKLLNKLNINNNISSASNVVNDKRKALADHFNQNGAVYDNSSILNAYHDLYINNKIQHGGKVVNGVLPDSFIKSLSESEENTPAGQQNIVYNALARDLMRHTLSLANNDLEADVAPSSFTSLQNEVRSNFNDAKLYYGSSNAKNNANLFLNVKEIKGTGDRSGFDALRLSFLNSTDFLYLPTSISGGADELQHVYGGFYNRQAVADEQLSKNIGTDLSSEYQKLVKLHK